MKGLLGVWIRNLYTCNIFHDITPTPPLMPKRTKVRAPPGPGAKKVKPTPAPFSISKDFQFRLIINCISSKDDFNGAQLRVQIFPNLWYKQ